MVGVIALVRPLRAWPDLVEVEKLEAERFDLRDNAEQRRPICKQACQLGLAACQLTHHGGEGGQSGSSESTPDPDRVQARRFSHQVMLKLDLVSRRRQNQVIVYVRGRSASVILKSARLRGAVAPVRVEQRRSDHGHRVWNRCCGRAC